MLTLSRNLESFCQFQNLYSPAHTKGCTSVYSGKVYSYVRMAEVSVCISGCEDVRHTVPIVETVGRNMQ